MAFYDPNAKIIRLGDKVYDTVDPRHTGRVILINSGLFATIKWDDHPSYYSTLPLRVLKLAATDSRRNENEGEQVD